MDKKLIISIVAGVLAVVAIIALIIRMVDAPPPMRNTTIDDSPPTSTGPPTSTAPRPPG